MAGGVNKVILIGNLGADPEVRFTPGGQAVANFRIATNESWTDKQGAKQERTEWHRIVVWGKLAELCGEARVRDAALRHVPRAGAMDRQHVASLTRESSTVYRAPRQGGRGTSRQMVRGRTTSAVGRYQKPRTAASAAAPRARGRRAARSCS